VIETVFGAMDEKIKIECLMWLLIKALGTQKAVAKAIGVRFQKINYWLNHAKTVPTKYLSLMLGLLRTYGIVPTDQVITLQDVVGFVPVSERIKLAVAFATQQGERRGRRSQKININHSEKRHPSDRFEGRTDDFLAKQYGFRNRKTYRQALEVTNSEFVELIAAMNNQTCEIWQAHYLLLNLSESEQRDLLKEGKAAISAYFASRKPGSNRVDITKALKLAHKHPRLMPLEPEVQQLFQEVFKEILYAARC